MMALAFSFMCRKKLLGGTPFCHLLSDMGTLHPPPHSLAPKSLEISGDFRKNRVVGNTYLDILNFSEHRILEILR